MTLCIFSQVITGAHSSTPRLCACSFSSSSSACQRPRTSWPWLRSKLTSGTWSRREHDHRQVAWEARVHPPAYPSDIEKANDVDVAKLRDPEEDSKRAPNPEWLVVIGVCTHLGCVPLPNAGDYGGWFCPATGPITTSQGVSARDLRRSTWKCRSTSFWTTRNCWWGRDLDVAWWDFGDLDMNALRWNAVLCSDVGRLYTSVACDHWVCVCSGRVPCRGRLVQGSAQAQSGADCCRDLVMQVPVQPKCHYQACTSRLQ